VRKLSRRATIVTVERTDEANDPISENDVANLELTVENPNEDPVTLEVRVTVTGTIGGTTTVQGVDHA
jgi:hypothetical protein